MALSSLLSITWLTLAAPAPPVPTPTPSATSEQPVSQLQDIRVVLFISAPQKLQRALVEQIAIPVGQDIELVPMDEFQAAAKRAHLRRAGSLKSAVVLARPLRLSHVVTLSVSQPKVHKRKRQKGRRRHGHAEAPNEAHTVLEVFVGRLRPNREMLEDKRYFLQNGRLSPGMAQTVVEHIKTLVQVPPKKQAPPKVAEDAEAAPAEQPDTAEQPQEPAQNLASKEAPPRRDKAAQEDIDPLTQDVMAEQAADEDAQKAEVAINANHVLHARGSVALTVVQRNAYLTAGAQGQSPPCYCGQGTFAKTFLGLHLAAELFFREGVPGLGAITDLTLYLPHTDVQTDGQDRTITSIVSDFRLALAWRWHSSIGLELTPRVGWGLFDFPLADGDFPGLSYSYPYVGLDLAWVLGNDAWRINVTLDYLAALNAGQDAARLGQKNSGSGLNVEGGIAWNPGPVELSLRLLYTKRSMDFAGKTFLFTTQTFDNVNLSDQQIQLLLGLGTHFW